MLCHPVNSPLDLGCQQSLRSRLQLIDVSPPFPRVAGGANQVSAPRPLPGGPHQSPRCVADAAVGQPQRSPELLRRLRSIQSKASNQLSFDDSSITWLCLVLAKQGHQGFEVNHCIGASDATVIRPRPAQMPCCDTVSCQRTCNPLRGQSMQLECC